VTTVEKYAHSMKELDQHRRASPTRSPLSVNFFEICSKSH
jgi:hypothetical protein